MNKNWLTLVNRLSLFLYLIGALLMYASIAMAESHKEVAQAMEHLGLSVLITTLVSSVLNYRFERAIANDLSIIDGAEKSGITDIYQDRKTAISRIVLTARSASNQIDILAIAGTSFFCAAREDMLDEMAKRCKRDSNISVRILLLSPKSEIAKERAKSEELKKKAFSVEQFNHEKSTLFIDITTALTQLERFLQDASDRKSFKVEVKTYDFSPMLFYVRVDDEIFVEQYHNGFSEEDQHSRRTACLGQKVPVIRLRHSSMTGHLLKAHFEFLWTHPRSQVISPSTPAEHI